MHSATLTVRGIYSSPGVAAAHRPWTRGGSVPQIPGDDRCRPCGTKTRSFRPKELVGNHDPSGSFDRAPLWVHQDASDTRSSRAFLHGAMGMRDGTCGHSFDVSASAPWEPPCRPLDWAAGAPLRGVDPGHHGVNVHATAAPGGFSAAATTGGTTHEVFLWSSGPIR